MVRRLQIGDAAGCQTALLQRGVAARRNLSFRRASFILRALDSSSGFGKNFTGIPWWQNLNAFLRFP
jgi:hypothetical protein